MSVPTASDAYFRGLLSRRLGPDSLIDDELLLLIIEDRDFQSLCTIYSAAKQDAEGVAARVNAKAKLLHLGKNEDGTPHNWAIWSAILDDPRFDLVWKRALDDLREPLPIVRHSLFERLLSFFTKLKKSTANASALPLLLFAIAATSAIWAVPVVWDLTRRSHVFEPRQPAYPNLSDTNRQLAIMNANLKQLIDAISACAQCKGSTPVQPTLQDLSPLIREMEKQRHSSIAGFGSIQDAIHENSKSVISLKESSDVDLKTLTNAEEGIKATLSPDGELGKKLDLIEQDTKSTADTLAASQKTVGQIQKTQTDAIALRDTLREYKFTIDNLRTGAIFVLALERAHVCIAFQVIQIARYSVILRHKAIQDCQKTSSTNDIFTTEDHLSIRLNTTPRLISTAGGPGAMGLYLSLEQERDTSVIPPSGKRAFIGAYSKADWTIKQLVKQLAK